MNDKHINRSGLKWLLARLQNIFATIPAVQQVEDETKQYITEVDYAKIVEGFDMSEIVQL